MTAEPVGAVERGTETAVLRYLMPDSGWTEGHAAVTDGVEKAVTKWLDKNGRDLPRALLHELSEIVGSLTDIRDAIYDIPAGDGEE